MNQALRRIKGKRSAALQHIFPVLLRCAVLGISQALSAHFGSIARSRIGRIEARLVRLSRPCLTFRLQATDFTWILPIQPLWITLWAIWLKCRSELQRRGSVRAATTRRLQQLFI
jgi:hypothetical protein